MRIMPLLLALSLAVPAAARTPVPPACQTPESRKVDTRDPAPRARPLSEMPPARQVLTVLRSVNGCTRPVVVREEIGARPRR